MTSPNSKRNGLFLDLAFFAGSAVLALSVGYARAEPVKTEQALTFATAVAGDVGEELGQAAVSMFFDSPFQRR